MNQSTQQAPTWDVEIPVACPQWPPRASQLLQLLRLCTSAFRNKKGAAGVQGIVYLSGMKMMPLIMLSCSKTLAMLGARYCLLGEILQVLRALLGLLMCLAHLGGEEKQQDEINSSRLTKENTIHLSSPEGHFEGPGSMAFSRNLSDKSYSITPCSTRPMLLCGRAQRPRKACHLGVVFPGDHQHEVTGATPTSGVITYIFLNGVGVLDAQDSLTHQNSLLLVTESLWAQAGTDLHMHGSVHIVEKIQSLEENEKRKTFNEGHLVVLSRLTSRLKKTVTWIPVFMEISLSRVLFWRPYFSTTRSTLSLHNIQQLIC
ncbi:hypothetical protein F7725_020805 [Dissostichus mawsoni]|uniref:Uncharacterized protein n=1 Tax=Dissostichus mawsoni TaxID=36200 RepID=A0A7J5YGZ9_DISMA|nr:hypothetical protein F7725_020805 [Dissostichus mawsoni]